HSRSCLSLALAAAIFPVGARAELAVWAVGDSEKLHPTAVYEASNFFWDGATRTLRLHSARNEVIAFQIALRSDTPLAGVDLLPTGDFTGPGGSVGAEQLDFYLEYFADIEIAGNDYPGDYGFDLIWPDALIPFRDPYESDVGALGAPFALAANTTAVVWADLFVPPGTLAGDYTVGLRVRVNGATVQTLNLALKVWDFTLPAQNHLWHYGLITSRWGDGEGVPLRDLPDSWPVLKNYLIDGRKHRLCWDDTYWPCPSFDAEGHLIAMDWSEFDLYEGQRLSGSLFTEGPMAGATYELARLTWPAGGSYPPGCPNIFYPPDPDPVGNPVYENTIREYIEEYVRHYVSKGWNMPLALYGYDEVGSAAYHQWWAGLVDEANQNLIAEGTIAAPRVLYMYVRASTQSSMIGYADLWAVRASGYNVEFGRARQAEGAKMMFYHWSEPRVGHHTINTYGFSMRTKPLIAWKYRVDGIYAEWSATNWQYVNQLYNGKASDYYDSRWGNGLLYYPGSRLSQAGYPVAIDGPVPSIRLKALRRGMQDYEYAWLLESLGGDPDALIDAVIVSALNHAPCTDCLGDWSHDADDWYQLRWDLAAAIDSASPVELPRLAATPAALAVALPLGGAGSDSLRLANTGGASLSWQAEVEDAGGAAPAWLRLRAPAYGLLAPGEWTRLVVDVDAAGLAEGTHQAHVVIESNDPVTPHLELPVTLAVGEGAPADAPVGLGQNHPNPFPPGGTTISFSLEQAAPVTLEILDAQGRLVRRLLVAAALAAGPHELPWDGKDAAGEAAASGVYLAVLRAGGDTLTRKMLMLR
ncbi:DUF4091 domain-containing protein, partial [bacterium]|nr:DUF4091 domain-containing protein [bacterium]